MTVTDKAEGSRNRNFYEVKSTDSAMTVHVAVAKPEKKTAT